MIKYDIVIPFSELSLQDAAIVGGKNSSLGELLCGLKSAGVNAVDGFAITVRAYWNFIGQNHLKENLTRLMENLDRVNFSNLNEIGNEARSLMQKGQMPENVVNAIKDAYQNLSKGKELLSVAVRSSATAEDMPQASFAGQHDSFLNVHGEDQLIAAVQACFTSMFNNRAIKYREDNHFDHLSVGMSVGIQPMVRSDLACSGVGFTIEPESGFRDIILLTGVWGLGENIVQGAVTPDEFLIFKPNVGDSKRAIISKKLGAKEKTMVYNDGNRYSFMTPVVNLETPKDKQGAFVLTDEEINTLAEWSLRIERHYKRPMDIEWAKDGVDGKLYIIQARPETVRSLQNPYEIHEYKLHEKGILLATGEAVGNKIVSGVARILASPKEADRLSHGEILITDTTSPDWDPVLRKVGGIITNKGGRTSHASIVARELGVAGIVGASNASSVIRDGQTITMSCAEGKTGFIYDGKLTWHEEKLDLQSLEKPKKTRPMLILGDPEKAFKFSFYPCDGVGLMRIEFIINNSIRIHPMALINFDQLKDESAKAEIELLTHQYPQKEKYFIDKLAEAVATIACAFYPREVIVRMSDFKTNEYANLIGGNEFEPAEENPMLGFRGASRYYHERYKEGFRLECEAMKIVRNEMGLDNVKLMIPFCRTLEEGKRVVEEMAKHGLRRGENKLEIYVMVEIPSNVLLAEEFARIFDGFSIGSNDLTQLVLGIDRDSAIVASLFSEQNSAVSQMISSAIKKAKKAKVKIGLCGQAPSDFPEFAKFLVEEGINSISFNADSLFKGIENINKAEKKLQKSKVTA